MDEEARRTSKAWKAVFFSGLVGWHGLARKQAGVGVFAPLTRSEGCMKPRQRTITKKDLCDEIADNTKLGRPTVRLIVQEFLDAIVKALSEGKRLEFREFGVFEIKHRAARRAQNPKTLEPVEVPAKRTIKFKPGLKMRETLEALSNAAAAAAEPSRVKPATSQTPVAQQAKPTRDTVPNRDTVHEPAREPGTAWTGPQREPGRAAAGRERRGDAPIVEMPSTNRPGVTRPGS
jgi:integration host factor subunit beta